MVVVTEVISRKSSPSFDTAMTSAISTTQAEKAGRIPAIARAVARSLSRHQVSPKRNDDQPRIGI